MCTVIRESLHRSTKDRECMASLFLLPALCDLMSELTFTEKRHIVYARKNNFNIKTGERYLRQFNKDGGDTWSFEAIPSLHKICLKYNLYWS